MKTIKFVAVLSSGILSGGSFYVSAFAVPSILAPYKAANNNQQGQAVLPAKTLQIQWKHVYDTGKRFFPFLGLQTSALYLYLAVNEPVNASRLYLLAAVSTISMVPYTFAVMMGNIKKIEAEVKEDDAEDTVRLRNEIVKWGKLNYGRSVMGIVGFVLGTWATVDSR